MTNELDKFRQDSIALRQRHAQLSQARLPSPVTIQSTASPTKWGLGDLASLRHVTGFVAKEVDQLKGLNKDFAAQMTELQPGAEKVQAKRNEIARYIKAKKDPKYARLLKTRTSSPEHVESQTKLRKSIQVVRERTRQLEDFMAKQKSRIQKQKEGKRDFKVPSIDTINRTMRNIDAALAQKTDEITVLTTRVDRMKLKAPRRKASTTGAAPITLPPVESEKIKLASAAALNMERASLRLKNALLQVRTETPLNSAAVGAAVETKSAALAKSRAAQAPRAPAPAMALPPGPSSVAAPSFTLPAPSTPSGLPPKPATTPSAPFALAAAPAALPAFSPLGKDEFHVTAAYEHSSRRSDKARMHGASAKLKTPSPNISRTIPEAPITPIPAPALIPAPIPAAKSFFGATAPVAVQPARNPVPFSFASFSPSSSPSAAPPPPSGFSFFQTPAQKAAPASTTPALPPIPKWGLPANFSIPSSSTPKSSKTPKEEPEAKDEEEDGEEDDDEEDEDWTPEDGEEEEEDEEEDVSDEAEEEDEDKTV
ncbi:hypothetical protein BDV93DRAFT_472133 [Ceratobasidium sp. AG-I]|nr:hypothetical protein BDV93DRAFT_472133 [Ceratobasidium sp. AG-I]